MNSHDTVVNKKRIAKNTLLLYLRMLFTMFINLYSTRLVLSNLGVEDMGIYGFVGSIVGFFSVFVSGLTTTIQRFITFESGKKNGDVNLVFCTSVNVLLICSFVLAILIEIGGSFYIYQFANLPHGRHEIAFWVMQCSVVTSVINLISIPYNALIIANEKMNAFAVISFLQVLLNCISAFILVYFTENRLIIYSICLLSVGFIIRVIYQIYCRLKFDEAEYHFLFDKGILNQIAKFTVSTSASGGLQVISGQGVVFIINAFFGVTLNAVYLIALQIKNSFMSFSYNLNKAISPQITKSYANGEQEAHKQLVLMGSKFEVFLNYFIMIPFVFKADYIMKLWLGNVPDYATLFARCIVFVSLMWACAAPFYESVMATGKVKRFLIVPELVYMIVLPVSCVVCYFFMIPLLIILCIVIFEFFAFITRIYLAVNISNFCMNYIIRNLFLPCFRVGIISYILIYLLSIIIVCKSVLSLIMFLALTSLVIIAIISLLGLNIKERQYIYSQLQKFVRRKIVNK